MKSLIVFTIFSLQTFAHFGDIEYPTLNREEVESTKDLYLTIDSDFVVNARDSVFMGLIDIIQTKEKRALIKVKEGMIDLLSAYMHKEYSRCGGFFRYNNQQEALEMFAEPARPFAPASLFNDYKINDVVKVTNMIDQIEEQNISEVIIKLSSFRNRYYKSRHGVNSSNWIHDHWKNISGSRTDVEVRKWEHEKWPQPSIILEIKGKSDEVIVVGGHADSIAGFFGSKNAKAPGADDNASGIATMTEIIRVLMQNNYQPEKTIMFMAYAAEEVGLLGSKEIAKDFKEKGVNVIGVLQLDMTNYHNSQEDIILITDFTNKSQNDFMVNLIETYLPELTYGFDKCGYACSDHASWTAQGFPASTPFEARKRDMNDMIHTRYDTFEKMGENANHAAKFAKLGLAYVIELDQ